MEILRAMDYFLISEIESYRGGAIGAVAARQMFQGHRQRG
jgi:hypothetical protein